MHQLRNPWPSATAANSISKLRGILLGTSSSSMPVSLGCFGSGVTLADEASGRAAAAAAASWEPSACLDAKLAER